MNYYFKAWNLLALDGSNWQKVNLFEFQRDVRVWLLLCRIFSKL